MLSGFRKTTIAAFALSLCAVTSRAATISGNVENYNAAQVALANGILTVPASPVTYTASAVLTVGSSFVVTLPSGFTFGSAPSLSTSGSATFTLASGGMGSRSATFTVATANVVIGDTISLPSFTVQGATALETVTPSANALPMTMQAIGTDMSALSYNVFASDPGVQAIFVGAIEFIDIDPPSNGTKFGTGVDSLTVVISAIAVSKDSALGANGMTETLSNSDSVTVSMHGNWSGLAKVFSSNTSECNSVMTYGTVTPSALIVPNVPLEQEVFFCVTGNGGVIEANPSGFSAVTIAPTGTSPDFLAAPVDVEFPGEFCYHGRAGYGNFGYGCVYWNGPNPYPTPALSSWGMFGLGGLILALGAWKLKGVS